MHQTPKPCTVLGLSGVYPWDHDAAACLIKDGTIVAYAEEERFSRTKKAFNLPPHNAITFCLESTNTDINEIEVITCGLTDRQVSAKDILPEKYAVKLNGDISIRQISHHKAHAASVFYTSPFEQAAVLVIDGQGDAESISIWKGTDKDLRQIASWGANKSLGFLYGAIATYCGFGEFGGGKVMGLAPYGQPKYLDLLTEIYQSIDLPPDASTGSDEPYIAQFLQKLADYGFSATTYEYIFDDLTQQKRKLPKLEQVHKDLAASVQSLLEHEVLRYATQAKKITGSDYLCLAGGVAMNCVANSIVQNSGIFKDVFIQPGCEDCGVALGSALAWLNQKVPLRTPYLGPAFNDHDIGAMLEARGISAVMNKNITVTVAKLLADNQIVGWFQGGLEYGPRALGNRSILANPATTKMRDKVNAIKRREPWRPFGPSVLAEHANEIFEHSHESNYMLRSFTVREIWRQKLAAVVHVDNSTRPQTVSRHDNPRFYDLIAAFEKLTGIPAVLNTSFNNYDEPIVATPDDALKTFYSSDLDVLVLGAYLVYKTK